MSSSYAPCAACKYLRRKCPQECVFAPYFPPDNPQKFINVHKVFGASNVGKILNELSPNQRNDAVNSLAYEAECRIKDPIYGCVGFVSILQHHLRQVQQEIDRAKRELATYIGPAAMQPMLNNPAAILQQQQQQNLDPGANYHNPHQTAPFQGQVLIQEQPQQLAAMAREQEMLRAYAQQQQQQQEQLYLQQMQQQELYALQQQRMQQELYVQQQQQQQQQQQDDLMRFNDAVDPDAACTGGAGFVQIPAAMDSFENQAYQYQVLQQEQQQQHGHPHHHQQQLQIDHELLLQQQQQHLQLIPQHLGSHSQQQQGERDGSDDEHSFSPL